MRWIVAALVLLLVQQAAWREPLWFLADGTTSPSVEALLEGGRSTPTPVDLVGRVVDASPTFAEGVRLTVDVETAAGKAARGLLSVSLRQTSRRWRNGDRLALRSRLKRIAAFGNFGELDWAAYNARRGVFVSASAWTQAEVEVLEAHDSLVDRLRRRFSEACERAGGQGAEILEALVIGDRTGIDGVTNLAVRDAGLAHFLAISGSHMALIVALVVACVRRGAGLTPGLMERYDVRRAAAVLAAIAVVAYGAVCGGGVSVVRSELMALAAMTALWRGRPGDDLRALGGSAIAIAIGMPGVGEEAGFQLSYLAVLALVLDSRRRRAAGAQREASSSPAPPGMVPARPHRLASHCGRALHVLLEAARLTLVCWLVTAPVVAHHFQRISLVAPLANLLAAPLVSAIVVSGIAGLVLLPVSANAGAAAVSLGAGLSQLVVWLSGWCASLPMAATSTVAPGPALTTIVTGLALLSLAPRRNWHGRLAWALALMTAALLARGVYGRYRDDRLDVWFASVGQGDAAVVRMPGGAVWVIDEGPPGRGRMVVGPLLRRAWVGRVDVLVASHVQSDHAGAMTEILEDFDVGEVWLPDGPCDLDSARGLLREAAVRAVPVHFVSSEGMRQAGGPAGSGAVGPALHAMPGASGSSPSPVDASFPGSKPRAGAALVSVLAPPRGDARCNDNDQSLVLSVAFAGRRVLFTGDIEAPGEARLTSLAVAVRSDVLKVAHHGSRTSSTPTFLDAVAPALAVASLGLDNSFHHPAPEVVARYQARGIQLLRTDRDGAVHLTIDADGTMTTETYREARQDSD